MIKLSKGLTRHQLRLRKIVAKLRDRLTELDEGIWTPEMTVLNKNLSYASDKYIDSMGGCIPLPVIEGEPNRVIRLWRKLK